uniref:Uncharacterized protein n=1 Tax=Timema poppense TaxID=170557 RepID=A0A7R9CIM8_TIMPO|nr:unnamed protein product [Timema poppensis]
MEEVITGVSSVSRHVDSSSHVQVDLHRPAPRVSGSACLSPGGTCGAWFAVQLCGLTCVLWLFSRCTRVCWTMFTPYHKSRWVFAALLVLGFLARVFLLQIIASQGWYIITYALGIYHLNLFIAFLSPKIDPALDYDGKSPVIQIQISNLSFNPESEFWINYEHKGQYKIQIHMIKYRYLPFTHGKPKYQGHEDTGKVISPK